MIQLLRRLFGGRFTKDQVVAVSRHVVTAVASGVAVAVALGFMGQDDADKAVEMVRQIGEGVAVIVGALGVLLPVISALFAGKSASTTAQIRKVESIPDVTVVGVTAKGDELVEKAKK
ncbi:hypothetical protein [Reyranella sp.]|uniref:hypothetical protein n=1 Tax=Reyranella sp. TaxID=1929291 RepID=UPI004036DE1C